MKKVIIFTIFISILFSTPISMRLAGMGEGLFGIVSDEETQILNNPAVLNLKTSNHLYLAKRDDYSFFIKTSNLGLRIDGNYRYFHRESLYYYDLEVTNQKSCTANGQILFGFLDNFGIGIDEYYMHSLNTCSLNSYLSKNITIENYTTYKLGVFKPVANGYWEIIGGLIQLRQYDEDSLKDGTTYGEIIEFSGGIRPRFTLHRTVLLGETNLLHLFFDAGIPNNSFEMSDLTWQRFHPGTLLLRERLGIGFEKTFRDNSIFAIGFSTTGGQCLSQCEDVYYFDTLGMKFKFALPLGFEYYLIPEKLALRAGYELDATQNYKILTREDERIVSLNDFSLNHRYSIGLWFQLFEKLNFDLVFRDDLAAYKYWDIAVNFIFP